MSLDALADADADADERLAYSRLFRLKSEFFIGSTNQSMQLHYRLLDVKDIVPRNSPNVSENDFTSDRPH